jgi:hypothetical protein
MSRDTSHRMSLEKGIELFDCGLYWRRTRHGSTTGCRIFPVLGALYHLELAR